MSDHGLIPGVSSLCTAFRAQWCIESNRLERETAHSPRSSAEVNTEWRFTTTPSKLLSGMWLDADVSVILLYSLMEV